MNNNQFYFYFMIVKITMIFCQKYWFWSHHNVTIITIRFLMIINYYQFFTNNIDWYENCERRSRHDESSWLYSHIHIFNMGDDFKCCQKYSSWRLSSQGLSAVPPWLLTAGEWHVVVRYVLYGKASFVVLVFATILPSRTVEMWIWVDRRQRKGEEKEKEKVKIMGCTLSVRHCSCTIKLMDANDS